MNRLFQEMNPTASLQNNNLMQIKNMMNVLRSSNNPQMLLQNMIQQNPQMQQVMNIVRQSGNDPKTAFYTLAKQRGVDPNQILQMLK